MWDGACVTLLQSRWAAHPICDPSRIIATRCSYCFVNPLRSQDCIYFQSHLFCNQLNHHERQDFFHCIGHQLQSAIFSCHHIIAQWTDVLVQWLLCSMCSKNMFHKISITTYFHNSTQYKRIIWRTGTCCGISIKFTGGSVACSSWWYIVT